MKKPNQSFESISPVLKRVAESFPSGSVEEKAIKTAAHALWFFQSHNILKKSFNSYIAKTEKPLPKSVLKHLRDMGIDSNLSTNHL